MFNSFLSGNSSHLNIDPELAALLQDSQEEELTVYRMRNSASNKFRGPFNLPLKSKKEIQKENSEPLFQNVAMPFQRKDVKPLQIKRVPVNFRKSNFQHPEIKNETLTSIPLDDVSNKMKAGGQCIYESNGIVSEISHFPSCDNPYWEFSIRNPLNPIGKEVQLIYWVQSNGFVKIEMNKPYKVIFVLTKSGYYQCYWIHSLSSSGQIIHG